METRFIVGTKEQYSIREDGKVIKHFKKQRITNTRTDIIITNNIIVARNNTVTLSNPKGSKCKPLYFSINNLLEEYFSFRYCKQCNNRFQKNISPDMCDSCRIENKRASARKYAKDCPEEVKAHAKIWRDNSCKTISRTYVANCLNIPVPDLTDELYVHHKQLLIFKRDVAKKHNISIHSLK